MSKAALAQEVKDLRADINAKKTEQAEQFTAAEQVEKKVKAKYADEPNVLAAMSDDDFNEIDAAYKAADELGETVAKLDDRLKSVLARNGETVVLPAGSDSPEVASANMGSRFLASQQYEAFKASGFDRNGLSAVEIASPDELRAMFLAASDGGGLIPVDQQLIPPVNIPRRMPRLMDFITVSTTDSDVVEWSRQTTQTDGASPTAHGGTASGESTYVWQKVQSNVRRIPTHTVVPESQLADQARLRTELDSELRRAVSLETESQALSGDGTGENFTGVLNTVGIASVAKGVDSIPDAVHKGITSVRVALEDDITAIGVHPNDYERYVLAKGTDGHYLSGRGPQDLTARTMWGYPAIVSTVFTEGTAVPANWAWAYLWVRSGLALKSGYMANQIIEDMITLAAEYRAAFAVKQAKAFAEVTGLNA